MRNEWMDRIQGQLSEQCAIQGPPPYGWFSWASSPEDRAGICVPPTEPEQAILGIIQRMYVTTRLHRTHTDHVKMILPDHKYGRIIFLWTNGRRKFAEEMWWLSSMGITLLDKPRKSYVFGQDQICNVVAGFKREGL